MKDYATLTHHIEALFDWGFKKIQASQSIEFHLVHEGVEIKFNPDTNTGAYIIDEMLSLIYDWETLEDLMEQIS